MAQRPIPHGYYAMTVDELRSFIDDGLAPGRGDAQVLVEIDGERFPVIKMVRGLDTGVVLRAPPLALHKPRG